jgi:hypothetical protein
VLTLLSILDSFTLRWCVRIPIPGSIAACFLPLVKANQIPYPIGTMCHTLGVAPGGYHAWTIRSPSKRAIEDEAMFVTAAAVVGGGTAAFFVLDPAFRKAARREPGP